MADKIGPKIQLEGEADFKKAIAEINTSLKTMGTEMKAVTSAYDRNDQSSEKLTAQNETLNKQIVTQKQKLEELKEMLNKSSAAYGENDVRTQKYQQQVNLATAALNKSELQLKNNTAALEQTEKGLEDVGKAAEDSGQRFENLGKTLKASAVAMGAVIAAAGAAAIKLGKEVVQQFGELEQNLGGSEAVFGEYAKSIQKTGEDAYKNMGVSQSDYLATANKMGALFQGSGLEQQKSLELTEKAMQRAADMASVMGIDMQVALDSVAGAAKGNFTMMDNLGVAMNATNIEAYAVANGLDFLWSKASEAEKAEVAMQMFFENTEQYAGNFAKESTETVTGSLGLLKAAIGSFTGGLGNVDADMQNLTANLVEAFQAVVANVVPIIENLASSMPVAFDAILAAVGDLLPTLLDTAINLFQQVLDTILKILPELIPVVVAAVMTITDTLIDNLPLILDGAFLLIITLAQGIIQALPELIPKIVEVIVTMYETMANNLPMIISMALQIILALTKGLIKAIPELVKAVPEIIVSIVSAFKDEMPEMMKIGVEIVRGVWDGIKSMGKWIKDKVGDFFSGVIDGVKGVLGIQSPSKVFAGIGEYMAEGLGQGFESEMKNVSRQIDNSIPTNIDMTGQYQASSTSGSVVSNYDAALAQSEPINITLTLDGNVLARYLYEPFQNEKILRGRVLTEA